MTTGPGSNKCRAAERCHSIRGCQRSRCRQRAQNSLRPRGGVRPGGDCVGTPRELRPRSGPGPRPTAWQGGRRGQGWLRHHHQGQEGMLGEIGETEREEEEGEERRGKEGRGEEKVTSNTDVSLMKC